MGCATLDDGERQQDVNVTLRGSRSMATAHPFGAHSASRARSGPKAWGGRIVAHFDSGQWSGKLVTITLPSGARGYVVVQATGTLTGVGDNPFDAFEG